MNSIEFTPNKRETVAVQETNLHLLRRHKKPNQTKAFREMSFCHRRTADKR